MRVLQVTTHMNIGGISNYVLSLAAALKRKDTECLVASSGGNMERELEKQGIRHMNIGIKTKFELSPRVFASAFNIKRIIKSEGIDIVHAHTRVAQAASYWATRSPRIPYTSTCHGFFEHRLGRRIFDFWGDMVIAISGPVRDSLVKDFKVAPERIALIHNGVDIDRFSRAYPAEELAGFRRVHGFKKDIPIAGTIGRLSPVKGHEFFIRALKEVNSRGVKVQGLIIGSGTEEDRLKMLAGSLGVSDSVFFIESRSDTARYLAIMDIFVFPSINEGLGLSLLEAMAAGRPSIASNTGGISDIIDDGKNGILFPVGDVDKLADGMTRLLGDEALRKRFGLLSQESVRNRFSCAVMAEKVYDFYHGLTGSHETD